MMVLLQLDREPNRSPRHRRHQGKLTVVDPVVLASARKHGIDDLTMLIGPDRAAGLLEVGVAEAEGVELIIHAMAARPKFLET